MTDLIRTARALSVMAFMVAAFGGGLRAQSTRPVRLLDTAIAAHDTIVLEELLPNDTSAKLRARASHVTLGNSPLPGISRVLGQSTLLRLLKSSPDLLQQLEIPARIMILRESRELTRQEIFRSIRDALAQNHFLHGWQLTPESIRMAGPVYVTQANSRLKVLRMSVDPASGTVFFKLWPSQEPKIHPFDVSISLQPGISAWDEILHGGGSIQLDSIGNQVPQQKNRQRAPSNKSAHKPPSLDTAPLVMPGQVATILLLGDGVRVQTYGLPLERGALGQAIRVRNAATGRILVAQVIARNYVQAAF